MRIPSKTTSGAGQLSFELELRRLIDSKFRRPPLPDNPIWLLVNDRLPLAGCRDLYRGFVDSLGAFNRVLIARLLETAPSQRARSELMPVIDVEFGPPVERAHPAIFERFLRAVGVPEQSIAAHPDLDNGPCRDEVAWLRSLSWCQLLARILVGETQGPVVFPVIAEAMQRNYGLTREDVFYFTLHAAHDKKDTEILFRLVATEAASPADRRLVLDTIERSFDQGRYRFHVCQLEDEPRYSYEEQFYARERWAA